MTWLLAAVTWPTVFVLVTILAFEVYANLFCLIFGIGLRWIWPSESTLVPIACVLVVARGLARSVCELLASTMLIGATVATWATRRLVRRTAVRAGSDERARRF